MKSNNNTKKFLPVFVLLISMMGLAQKPPQKFHDTKGNIEVTQAGQLQYTLSIDLPPGIKQTAPNISLMYVSGAGNGLAGYGWNISGITSISRTGKNIEKDGITKGVQLDYTDYFSFNGQRLILKSGEYGKDGAEYVTEKYSNVKIKSVGAVSGQSWQGPEYWEVTSPDGSQAWYGAVSTGNSPGRTSIDYNIVKSRDVSGNYISYNYITDGNVSVISSIQWGGNETKNTPHFNKIDFVFATRPMPETAYIKGILFSQSKLLESVVVSSSGNQYKKYNISYKEDLQKTAYRYLSKITVLNSKNEEANPVEFKYEGRTSSEFDGTYSFSRTTLLKPTNDDVVGDFDGDGNLDVIRYHPVITDKTPQIGSYLYKDFYTRNYSYQSVNPEYLGNSVSLAEIKNSLAVNFKKSNVIYNRQGFVSYKKVLNPSTSKNDLHLSFYILSSGNLLTLDFKKIIPNIDYYDDGSGLTEEAVASVLDLKNVDFNGDGLSELVLKLNYRKCFNTGPDPDNNKLPPGECINTKQYLVVDNDDTLQNNDWYYPISFGGDQDPFLKYRAGDFNGDGLFDFMRIDLNGKPLLITFHKNDQNRYDTNTAYFSSDNAVIRGSWDDTVVGDFNGDGLSDLMMPTSATSAIWYIYTSKGNGFAEDSKVFERIKRDRSVTTDLNQNIDIVNPNTFVAYDINNDGKTELIALQSIRYYDIADFQDSNQGTKYDRRVIVDAKILSTFGGNFSHLRDFGEDLTMYLNATNLNGELAPGPADVMGLSVDQWTGAMLRKIVFASTIGIPYNPSNPNLEQFVVSSKFFDIAVEGRIKSISQGGLTTNITYKPLDKTTSPGLYDNVKTESYPYVEVNQSVGMYVVSALTQSLTTNKILKQDFRYRGLTSNILGRGMISFKKTARSSWYTDGLENTKIWSGVETDPLNDGVPVKEWSIRTNNENLIFPADVSENNTQLLSFKSTTYQTDKLLNGQVVTNPSDADKAKIVTAILPKISRAKDFLTGSIAETAITYGAYYLPFQSISRINTSYGVTLTAFKYDNNPSGVAANYYIGRVQSKITTVQAYGDSKFSKEEYTYENNLVKTIKNWNRDNNAFTLHTLTYDGFGNMAGKTLSNSTDSGTVTEGYEYDHKGRFLVKQTDHLGLHTTTLYNEWGQLLSQTDPLGNTIINTYDDWGKVLTSTSNLKGATTYGYDKDDNANVILTQNDPDGNISKKFTNKLGQLYKASIKAFGQGKWISTETQYDVLGRKIAESEPYFDGQSASDWNTISYDDSVFPAKVTATSFTGKQSETTVSGLTTTVKELNGYARTNSKTADALGNIVSTTDKGGTIQFSYNAAGEQIQAKYAENTVTTKYDSWGRKSEFNDPSNGVYKYEYDGLGQPKKTISPKGTKEYIYNTLGQLVSQKELSTADAGQATNKVISFTYNDKGLLIAKSGIVQGQNFNSALTYDTKGRLVSSVENSNGRTYTQKGVIYDDKGRIISYEKELQGSTTTKLVIENVYSTWNGELYQIKDKNSGKILWELKDTNAKGQVLLAQLGAADITNMYDSSGFLSTVKHSSAAKPKILQITYSFDAIKNELKTRKTEGDFDIKESFDYDGNNRLVNWTNPVTGIKPDANRNVYDIKGRIMENDQVGTMKFENPAKIYQSTGMTLNSAGTQNYTGDLIQSITYNENNDPVLISGEKARIGFEYGLESMRQKVNITELIPSVGPGKPEPVWKSTSTKLYSEDGSFEVVTDLINLKEKHIIYIEGGPYESNIVYLKDFSETKASYKFLHKDYLGSILAITGENGEVLEQGHYDAWGNLTHLQKNGGAVITDRAIIAAATLLTNRGYTGHEHFGKVGIIHMNGRLYDPILRRFLNADENIQDPNNTQNYNKYGYVMNNPLMYNDTDGEFWLYAAGALVGGYLNGVAANNGNWNPGKWDWKKSWSAVLGGAIGGAAVSGALGNITQNAGAIKSFLPGIVSGGLRSAFTGSNFLGGAIGGITYTGTLFENKATSTDGNSAGYKYIVSPEENYFDDWEGLTKNILLNYVKANFCENCSYGRLQQMAGTKFEQAFHTIMRSKLSMLNYTSNKDKFPGMYKGRPRNTIPDGVFNLVDLQFDGSFKMNRYYGASLAEVKAMDGTIYSSSNQGQISAMLNYMGNSDAVRRVGRGNFMIGTTSDTYVSPGLYDEATKMNIDIFHYRASYRIISGAMHIMFHYKWTDSTDSTILK